LARDFPRIRWVLIGDDGQHDPKIYGDFARDRPDVVEAIAIRELTPTEQVLSHGIPVSNEEFAPRVRRDVPVCRAPDGYLLLRQLKALRDSLS
jgi:phosphatidate phosphatase APP1